MAYEGDRPGILTVIVVLLCTGVSIVLAAGLGYHMAKTMGLF